MSRAAGPVRPAVLVTAKVPVPGRVKTRLGAGVGMAAAADLAAAALLDTLAAASRAAPPGRRFLALDGPVHEAVRAQALARSLRGWTVLPQRGHGLGERLVAAHQDVAAWSGCPVVQVGMDTPQVTAADLAAVVAALADGADAVLGPAEDGGWWVLGLRHARHARALAGVPMSTADTGRATRVALENAGAMVATGRCHRDVDTAADAEAVAALAPYGCFGRAWAALAGQVPPARAVAR